MCIDKAFYLYFRQKDFISCSLRLDQEIHIWCRTWAIKLNDLPIFPDQDPTSIKSHACKRWYSPLIRGSLTLRQALAVGMSSERGEADTGQLNNSYRSAARFTGVIPPCGLSSLDMLPHTEPLVAPVQACEAQKVTPPLPCLLTGHSRLERSVFNSCWIWGGNKTAFSYWKLNRRIPLSCFSLCCCFLFIECLYLCFQNTANQEQKHIAWHFLFPQLCRLRIPHTHRHHILLLF